ncbi:MAG: hypothetical protein ACI9EF_002633 [Pseudohongiellaceae bacterium]|jgi:hypothetical protein
MPERFVSLLLVLGLLLPQWSLCTGRDVSETGCTTRSDCCCGETAPAPESGPTVAAEFPGFGGCPCFAETPSVPAPLTGLALAESVPAPLISQSSRESSPVDVVDWSGLASARDQEPGGELPTRPLRLSTGVCLI